MRNPRPDWPSPLCRICEEEEAEIDGLCRTCYAIQESLREDNDADEPD